MSKENKKIDHSARKHALLSASGASRWMACTPSPLLESEFENKSSHYAEEGTLAHEFAELNLKLQLSLISKSEYNKLVKPFKANKWYSQDMEDFVQIHIDYVVQQFTEAKRKTEDALLLIEEKLDMTDYIEEGFGTGDDVVIGDGILEVIDLKYGKGVRVSAKNNPQGMLYGLGALSATELMFDIHTVRITITQPRLDSISSWDISVEDLKAWGNDVVKPKAEMAYVGDGDLFAGEHCRFCKVKARCPKLAEESMTIAKQEFADPKLLTDDDIVENYKKFKLIQDWIKAVETYMMSEALNGKKWKEHKLVKGRSNRTWSNKENAENILKKKKFKKADYMSTPSLLGIGAIEKLVGKTIFQPLMGECVVKPEGKPTLVHEDDKRDEFVINNAKTDFAE